MIAVIFEVSPKVEGKSEYLDIAAGLAPQLQKIDGFISIERFVSINNPNRLLSLSFWQDESAVVAWREAMCHQAAQAKGREVLFADYRLRVTQVLRDYGMNDRAQAPK